MISVFEPSHAQCEPFHFPHQILRRNMGISAESLEKKLRDEFEASHVEVVDESGGCGAKFNTIIVSNKFTGKPLLQRQRMVHACLKEELETIHAFSMKTWTEEQWKQKQEGQ